MKGIQNQSLTIEQAFFLSVLSDYVNERKSPGIPATVDTTIFASLSNAQQLSPIIFYQTRLSDLQPSFAGASYYAVNRKRLLSKIDQSFRAAHIHYLIFKGSEVAQYYQHPYLRTSGDIDLLVKEKNKERAGEVLEELGFASDGKKKANHEWLYQKSDFEIELHHRLLYNCNLNDEKSISFTDTVWDQTSTDDIRHYLGPEFHFVFLLLHLRKHFLWAGVGIRQFLDLAVMARIVNMDWRKIADYIDTCGIEKFSSVCFALINCWFGVSIPLPTASISDEFYSTATTTVLSGSAFGDMGSDNILDNYVLNAANKNGKIKSALALFFPPVSQLSMRYPTLTSYPFLLPFFWLRRAIESLFKHSTIDGLSYAAKYMNPNEARNKELKAWGLLEKER